MYMMKVHGGGQVRGEGPERDGNDVPRDGHLPPPRRDLLPPPLRSKVIYSVKQSDRNRPKTDTFNKPTTEPNH